MAMCKEVVSAAFIAFAVLPGLGIKANAAQCGNGSGGFETWKQEFAAEARGKGIGASAIAALASKAGLHAPYRDQRPRRHAIALLDRCKQRSLRLLERTAAGDDGRGAALGEELVERQAKTALATIG